MTWKLIEWELINGPGYKKDNVGYYSDITQLYLENENRRADENRQTPG
jgi:hypothetical protein